VSALAGRVVPPTTVVWQLTRSRAFPVLQQLYNVTYAVQLPTSITALPATPGPAWFPAQIEIADDAPAVAAAIAARGADLRATLLATAWLVRGDPHLPTASTCAGARVRTVTTDDTGQTARIEAEVPAGGCVLVVATSYIGALRATAGDMPLPVFPIDVALTGIAVPAGRVSIFLTPVPVIPMWTRGASILGLALLGFAIAQAHRRARR
jgi:hypothetical protein